MAHIRRLPSGRWRFIAKAGGLQLTGTFDTKEQARLAGAEADVRLGRQPKAAKATLRQLIDAHIAGQGYAATTLADLRSIRARIPADVFDWEVRKVTPFTVESLYRRLGLDGWTPHRIGKLHMLLSSAWSRAVRYGWATRNIMRDVDRPRVLDSMVSAPSTSSVRKVIAGASGTPVTYLRLAVISGARRGELVGLQWSDLDLETATMIVRRSVSHVAEHDGAVVTDGKTGRRGHRVISLDPTTVEQLQRLRRTDVELALGSGLPSPVWVFSHDAGVTPWRGDYISHYFARVAKAANVPPVRPHDLRHYMATTMLAAGVPVTVVAERLGHRNGGATTQAVYSHAVPAVDKAATERLAAALDA